MPGTSGLLALGQALDTHLLAEVSPPPGTQLALGFLPGIGVDPSSFAPTGVVNPLAVQTFLAGVANVLGPVVDGRFAGFLSAHQVYGMLLDVASPLDPPGSPAADAFLSVKHTARSAFSASPVKQLVSVPLEWYDPDGSAGWSTFTTTTSSRAGEEEAASSGTPPPLPEPSGPVVPPERFERLWRWRTLDEAAQAEVVVPQLEHAVEVQREPLVRDHRLEVRQPLVRDHRGVDVQEVAVRTSLAASGTSRARLLGSFRVAEDAAEVPAAAVLARAPRRQLLAALEDPPVLADRTELLVRAEALAHRVEVEAPAAVQELDGEASSSQSVESGDLTLSLQHCTVQLSRDAWWNDAVLRMPRWYVPGCRAGAFSSSGGQPVALPIAMVLTRGVTVSGRWSESDRRAAASHTSLGPWSLRESELAYDESTQTATLAIPGMQVVALLCALLPTLPPADDPAL